MNKQVFCMTVVNEWCEVFESILSNFRIGLNNWDKTRPLNINGIFVSNYTVVCENNVWNNISDTFLSMVY